MSPPENSPQSGPHRPPSPRRLPIVWGVSIVLLLPFLALAGDILRGGAARNAPSAPGNAANTSAAAAQARSNAKDALARTTQALQAVQNMQAAARAAAKSGPNNLGANPNAPTFQLPDVPDGIGPGGLEVHPSVPTDPTLWSGASQPTQSGNTVTITQTSQQAVLNWKTFNVGKNTTVNFDQTAGGTNVGTWIAFNKVTDPSGSPTQILGNINAAGQVYIINQNGIIFGGSSQVNVHTLVASSLPINAKYNPDGLLVNDATNASLLTRGLLNNPDAQFLFSSLPLSSGTKGPTAAFTPPAAPASGVYGDVTVQAGASLTAPTSAEHVGGRIALIGPNVTNAGSISTPDGQTILAAGLQVGFDSHKTSDPSLRGLDVYVGAVVNPASTLPPYAGTATNQGLIDVPRGNTTLTGKTVNQLGAINSSTSVSLNGRIDLLANYGAISNPAYDPVNSPEVPAFLFSGAGLVELGAKSLTQILPEVASTEKVVGSQLSLRSQINIQGTVIHAGANASILAPNAVISFNAGAWNFAPSLVSPTSSFVNSSGQIYLDSGVMVNVAGSVDVSAPLSQYILMVKLRGSEFADSPLQRTSIFRPGDGNNPSITVDLRKTGTYNGVNWVGTPLADLTSYLGLVQHTVGELTVAGGSVKFSAGSSLVVQSGASINVSGGFTNYEGGSVKTTRIFTSGHLLDIADATPDMVYTSIYTGTWTENHPRWGVTKTYLQPLALLGEHYEQGYIQGADGGSLQLTAPAVALDGNFIGTTLIGPRQRSVAPGPSSISLSFEAEQIVDSLDRGQYSPTPPTVTFKADANQSPADPFALEAGNPLPLRADRIASVVLSPELLTKSGFSSITVNNPDGAIVIPKGISLTTAARGTTTSNGKNPNGSIVLTGSNISILGTLAAPGGNVTATVNDISQSVINALRVTINPVTPVADTTRGLFTLAAGASISTVGLVIDDRQSSPTAGELPMTTKGGTVILNAYNAELTAGSVVDVSGGVAFSLNGKRTYGDAGSITINTGRDPNQKAVVGGHLKLEGTLKGYSGAKGGSLSLQAPLIQIGGSTTNPAVFLLSPDFFNEGGFSNFALTGFGAPTGQPNLFTPGVLIAPGTVIEPKVKSWLAVPFGAGAEGATLEPFLQQEGLRTPVSLSFNAIGITDSNLLAFPLVARGDVVMGEGARILTDAGGSVSFKGDTVAIYGSVFAPGGSIVVSGAGKFPTNDPNGAPALATVYLGANSSLSTAGKVVLKPDAYGRRVGTVYPGGSISLSGNIIGMTGSVLDVSGTSGVLDLAPSVLGDTPSPLIPVNSGINAPLRSLVSVPTTVDSNGGTITLKGSQGLLVNSTFKGFAGGSTALGGSLLVSSGKFVANGATSTPADINLIVTQSKPGVTQDTAGIGLSSPSLGYFTVDSFAKGGFDSLTLGGNVQFSGPVTIKARQTLSVGSGGIIAADDAVHLAAAYVKLGQPFVPPLQDQEKQSATSPFALDSSTPPSVPPTFGAGSLTVVADLIDVGNLSLQGIGKLNLTANNGDIRGNGTLDVAGDIVLRAGQIYPTSASNFTIAAYDYKVGAVTVLGSVTILGSGSRDLPLSAGGELDIYGSNIYQGGVLRAPLGTINIGWDGTGTAPVDSIFTGKAFAISQQVTLATGSVTSVSAISPVTGLEVLIPYGFSADGKSWIDPKGANITTGGLPIKSITIAGVKVTTETSSSIDLRGGGDIYAYQWVPGTGGSKDVLASGNSFAVIPGYDSSYSPYAPFNTSSASTNLASTNPGYVNNALSVGDRVVLGASKGLPGGTYTLLPARYALLPGAFLVTPQSGDALGTFLKPEGASLVSGFSYSSLNTERSVPSLYKRFEVAPSSVVRSRSEYVDFSGNSFLKLAAQKNELTVPRLPMDAGHLILQAGTALILQGDVSAGAISGGRGGLVDISSSQDIFITGSGTTAPASAITLDSAKLSSYGAESLLIGGIRQVGVNGTTITVRTSNVTVDNAGSALSAPEVILVSNKILKLASGASITQTGNMGGAADTLWLNGNGTLLRVSSDASAQIIRTGVTQPNTASMIIGDNSLISGTSITLDSTYATSLSPTAKLSGQAINLNSGQISLQLDSSVPVSHNAIGGLVLAGPALQSLQSAQALSFLSYTALDLYGSGAVRSSSFASLSLHAAEIRGFNVGSGIASFAAQNILIDNSASGSVLSASAPLNGTLAFNASVIQLGANQVAIDNFNSLQLNATGGVLALAAGGLTTQGDLAITAPAIGGAKGSTYSLIANGSVTMQSTGGSATISPGLGASLTVQAGTSLTAGSAMMFPSGLINLRAKNGDLIVTTTLDAGGTAKTFFDLTKYTDGGQITLASDTGAVDIISTARLNVSAVSGGGNAGTVSISAPTSNLIINGTLSGMAGTGGNSGTLIVDAGHLPGGLLSSITPAVEGFEQTRSIRNRLDTTVILDGSGNKAKSFTLTVDNGTIQVTGTVDASGTTGGAIRLVAAGNIILKSGSLLSVAATNFDAAGKGGAVSLEAGSAVYDNSLSDLAADLASYVDIQSNSTINLSVALATSTSDALGRFQGTLHLRQPQDPSTENLQTVKPINGNIVFNTLAKTPTITFEGYSLFSTTPTSGVIDSSVQDAVKANAISFMGHAPAILAALNKPGLSIIVQPGAEVYNVAGDLVLGDPGSDASSDWDLFTYKFGSKKAPGVLTLRSSGDLVFYNALSDGFRVVNPPTQFDARLATINTLLPTNLQSWSYHLTAGADFTSADFHQVSSLGSLKIGKDGGLNPSPSAGDSAQTSDAVGNFYQVIRTGTGDIDISAGKDVQLLNQFATIYTAGVQMTNQTLSGTFDKPRPNAGFFSTGALGDPQQVTPYPAQYALAGGNVSISAQADIIHYTTDGSGSGVLIDDSERELPNNWLYRRGYVNPVTGKFGKSFYQEIASTTWWVDYSNFFEGIAALGGGNVKLNAGHDIKNVDALVPTNALMPGKDSLGKALAPNAASLIELGGGNLTVRAGHDINGGIYYVERGQGMLSAGNNILTNATRSPSLTLLSTPSEIYSPLTWLPTSLFLGKGSFNVSSRGDLLLGPVANTFLLPQGYNNTAAYKTYFSTYDASTSVTVSSIGGSVTLRESVTLPLSGGVDAAFPTLQAWMQNELLYSTNPVSASVYHPWLRLAESSVSPFGRVSSLNSPTLLVTSFSSDINLVGDLNLYPSSQGTLDLTAGGTISGLQQNGVTKFNGSPNNVWGTSRINVSDANPSTIPTLANPFGYQSLFTDPNDAVNTDDSFLNSINQLFDESGSTQGSHATIQTKQALHAAGLLHAKDTVPVHIYAGTGDITSITLFSPKSTRLLAGKDIGDIALYIQNTSSMDISIVSAGRDIIAYNETTRSTSLSSGNKVNPRETTRDIDGSPLYGLNGDIQISGPGTLEVLAGRNLDLGSAKNTSEGTGTGLTSIGNGRNPYLSFEGANIIAAAGLGASGDLTTNKNLNFTAFISQIVNGPDAARYFTELTDQLSATSLTSTTPLTASSFSSLSKEEQDRVALQLFFLALRDAGRDHNTAGSSGFGNYTAGYTAIATLFASAGTSGEITTQSRDIRTKSGGDITLLAPSGGLTLQQTSSKTTSIPPGIITEHGGNISIFTNGNVDIGISRIFTLRGGNEIIWSSIGNIAAGKSSQTVQSAPPTRVLIDPQSGNVQTDLAGLATGGGIGVLATVTGVAPGNVDLIAVLGTVDAGDAGIRATGNLNIAATAVLNASNISVSGTSTGTPSAPTVSVPNIGGLTSASSAAGASSSSADSAAKDAAKAQASAQKEELPSIIAVDVLGYGAGEGADGQ